MTFACFEHGNQMVSLYHLFFKRHVLIHSPGEM
jgi:hypothetical protein